ncbi:acyl carrier protein [Streptomyces sp. NPDC126503]|uniref:acyl carrier protein n=1 Tax=Streptomyces sp. NPDC126503 TaxID=3155315 RepID=UPI0033245F53
MREQQVSEIWAEVLALPEVDVDANFYDLGGHSLLLIELVGRLNQKLGIETDVVTVLEHPTVVDFTAHWNSLGASGTDPGTPATADTATAADR